jgi:hypothetical protein
MNLFKVLEFPIESYEAARKFDSTEEFLEEVNDLNFTNNERNALDSICKIALLFSLNTDNCPDIKEYDEASFAAYSILFICIELTPESNEKYLTPRITSIFNRIFNAQILIIFKESKRLQFSIQLRRKNKTNLDKDTLGSPFVSYWFDALAPSEENILSISKMYYKEIELTLVHISEPTRRYARAYAVLGF